MTVILEHWQLIVTSLFSWSNARWKNTSKESEDHEKNPQWKKHAEQCLHGEGASGLVQIGYPLLPHWCLPLGIMYLLRPLSNHRSVHRLWSQRHLRLIYFSCATLCARDWLYEQALKWYLLHGKNRGITTGHPGLLATQRSPGAFIWEAL